MQDDSALERRYVRYKSGDSLALLRDIPNANLLQKGVNRWWHGGLCMSIEQLKLAFSTGEHDEREKYFYACKRLGAVAYLGIRQGGKETSRGRHYQTRWRS